MTMLYIAGALALIIVIIFLCCLGCIIKRCFFKNNQVEIFKNVELTKSNYKKTHPESMDDPTIRQNSFDDDEVEFNL